MKMLYKIYGIQNIVNHINYYAEKNLSVYFHSGTHQTTFFSWYQTLICYTGNLFEIIVIQKQYPQNYFENLRNT